MSMKSDARLPFVCGVYEQVVVLVWTGRPTRARLDESFDEVERATERERCAMLAIIEASAPAPSMVDLPYIAARFDRLTGLVAVAGVFAGHHPWSALLLDATSTAFRLRRRSVPTKLGVDVAEAVTWLAPRVFEDARLHRAPLLALTDTLRRDRRLCSG